MNTRDVVVLGEGARTEADRGVGLCAFHLAVHSGEVKTQLAQMFGLEFVGLEFDHHIAAKLEVVEKQVDEKVIAANFQVHLSSNKGKARPQLKQELRHVFDEY